MAAGTRDDQVIDPESPLVQLGVPIVALLALGCWLARVPARSPRPATFAMVRPRDDRDLLQARRDFRLP